MSKIWEMGRKAMFYIRVLSGYEERRIRSYRLKLDHRLKSAQEQKEAVTKIPEQVVLSEVRRMVDEMQNLNKRLEEMESEINEYFSPIDKQVGAIMNMQMDQEKARREMMKRVLVEQAESQKAALEAQLAALQAANTDYKPNTETMSGLFKKAMLEKTESKSESTSEAPDSDKRAAQ